ncbi:MAG: hypothetical protein FVQ85_01860 [Planctomycetes bacterium]|nr:hypothetical protein [Planctomycetota bacterium]
MEKNCLVVLTFGVVICLLLGVGGCEIPSAKYERTVQLSAPLSAGYSFKAETHNGSITVEGRDEDGCDVTAVITGRASSVETAKDIADRTKVRLKNSGNKITVEIKKPMLGMYESVSVRLDVKLPKKTNILLLGTHNGDVTVSDIKGKVDSSTHNGSIKTELPITLIGKVSKRKLQGKIGEGLGKLQLVTHNGSIKIR